MAVSFDEEPSLAPQFAAAPKPYLIRLALKLGIANNDEQATYLILGAAVGLILAAIALVFFGLGHHPPAQTPQSPTWPKPVS